MYCYIWKHLLHQLYQFPSYCVLEGVSLTIVSFKKVFAIQPIVKDIPYFMVIRCMGIRTENNEVLRTVTAIHRTAYNILDEVSSPASWSHCPFCCSLFIADRYSHVPKNGTKFRFSYVSKTRL